jgi:hypothetical protein
MKAIPIAENIWWVGAIDWNAHHFHGQTFTTKRGTTYNAYLIIDEVIPWPNLLVGWDTETNYVDLSKGVFN